MIPFTLLLSVQQAKPVIVPPPGLPEREREWRRITDAEPTALIADLRLDLMLPNVPETYRGRWRYEALAASAGRELEWIEGVAVMRVPDQETKPAQARRRTIADWLATLPPKDVARLRENEMRVGELPGDVRRAVLGYVAGFPGDLLGATLQLKPAYTVRYRSSQGLVVTETTSAAPIRGGVITFGPSNLPAPYVPPVLPLPPAPAEKGLSFPEGKAMTVRELLQAAYREFGRGSAVDKRVAERTLFVRGTFTRESLARALVPITRVEPVRWLEPTGPLADRSPDLVVGALGEVWKDLNLPQGLTRDMLRKGFGMDARQAGDLSPVLRDFLAARRIEGPVRVRGGLELWIGVLGSVTYPVGVP